VQAQHVGLTLLLLLPEVTTAVLSFPQYHLWPQLLVHLHTLL
jgi:hypothetical protein